jgi:hypothetical protein
MLKPIPDYWKIAVISVLKSGSRRKIRWTIRAINDWQSATGWEPLFIADEAMLVALEQPTITGKRVTLMNGETWEFWFWWRKEKFYGKVTLYESLLEIQVVSAHKPLKGDHL